MMYHCLTWYITSHYVSPPHIIINTFDPVYPLTDPKWQRHPHECRWLWPTRRKNHVLPTTRPAVLYLQRETTRPALPETWRHGAVHIASVQTHSPRHMHSLGSALRCREQNHWPHTSVHIFCFICESWINLKPFCCNLHFSFSKFHIFVTQNYFTPCI